MENVNSLYNYRVLPLDLSIARNKSEFACGIKNTLLVRDISNISGNIKIAFDNQENEYIPLHTGDTFNFKRVEGEQTTPYFSRIYITNDSVVGTVQLVFANNIEIQKLLRITSDVVQEGIDQNTVAVTDAATALPAAALIDRINLVLYNDGTETVYIGNSAVTAAGAKKGVPLGPGESYSGNFAPGVTVYGICAAGKTSNVIVMEGA